MFLGLWIIALGAFALLDHTVTINVGGELEAGAFVLGLGAFFIMTSFDYKDHWA
jgi:hypothetical protein